MVLLTPEQHQHAEQHGLLRFDGLELDPERLGDTRPLVEVLS